MNKLLLIVPHSVRKDLTRSGVGTYIQGMQDNFDVTVIDEGPNTHISKRPYFNLGDSTLTDFYKVGYLQQQILDLLDADVYAAIICSTFEGVTSCVGLSLPKIMPVFYRVHNSPVLLGDKAGLGADKALRIIKESVYTGVRISCDCPATAVRIRDLHQTNATYSYNFISLEAKAARSDNTLLINSRYDDIKRPKLAARIAHATGMKIVVLTGSTRQVAKWEKLLQETGAKDFEVLSGISGQEKHRILSKACVSLHTAIAESFGLSVLESVPFCPTFIVQSARYDWSKNFEEFTSDLYVETIDRVTQESVDQVAAKIVKASKKKYSTDAERSAQFKVWRKLILKSWKSIFDSKVECSKPLSASLYLDLESGKTVDWKEQQTLMRTLRQLHKANAMFPLVVTGTNIRRKK